VNIDGLSTDHRSPDRARDGEPLPVPPGFAALRDVRHTDHELLEQLRPRFGDVLEALDAAGVRADDRASAAACQ
jgi:hypothetical protein